MHKFQTQNRSLVAEDRTRTVGKCSLLGVTIVIVLSVLQPVLAAWQSQTTMPDPVSGGGVAAVNGIIYVVGGGNPNSNDTLYAYDPVSSSWTTEASPPVSLEAAAVQELEGKLYVAGGVESGVAVLNSLYAYDPATNSWTTLANMPDSCGGSASGVIGGQLYVLCSSDNSNGDLTNLYVYAPATNMWSQLASSSATHGGGAYGVVNGKLYVAGGNSSNGWVTATEVYDPVANSWTELQSIPTTTFYGPASVALDGELYVMGGCNSQCNGFDQKDVLRNTYVYNPFSNEWKAGTKLPLGLIGAGATIDYGLMWVVGGQTAPAGGGDYPGSNVDLAVKPSIP